jgi:hypothetical protein
LHEFYGRELSFEFQFELMLQQDISKNVQAKRNDKRSIDASEKTKKDNSNW